MKNGLFFLVLLTGLSSMTTAFAQPVAVGGCNSAQVVSGIPVATNTTPWITGNYISGGNSCVRTWVSNSNSCGDGMNDPLFTLQRRNTNGNWTTVTSSGCAEFNNITTHGTYRIGIQLPTAEPGSGGCVGGVIRVFNTSGQFMGNKGAYTLSPFVFSNTFVVGASTSTDNTFTFVDYNANSSEPSFDVGDLVGMSTSASASYDLWHLAIFESGPNNLNRNNGLGWNSGRVPSNTINLTQVWKNGHPDWNFELNHSYTVQFVTENSTCRNGIEFNPGGEWNVRERTFFICPFGAGCRIGEEAQKIVLSPNPASSVVRLLRFEMDPGAEYHLTITDLAGKAVKSTTLTSNEVDISGLSNGMYATIIERDGKRIFTDKLVVNNQ